MDQLHSGLDELTVRAVIDKTIRGQQLFAVSSQRGDSVFHGTKAECTRYLEAFQLKVRRELGRSRIRPPVMDRVYRVRRP